MGTIFYFLAGQPWKISLRLPTFPAIYLFIFGQNVPVRLHQGPAHSGLQILKGLEELWVGGAAKERGRKVDVIQYKEGGCNRTGGWENVVRREFTVQASLPYVGISGGRKLGAAPSNPESKL